MSVYRSRSVNMWAKDPHTLEVATRGGYDELSVYEATELRDFLAGWIDSQPPECFYTFSHTRHWCGNATCRDS